MYVNVRQEPILSEEYIVILLEKNYVIVTKEQAKEFTGKQPFYFYSGEFSLKQALNSYDFRMDLERKQRIRVSDDFERKIKNILDRIEMRMKRDETIITMESCVYLFLLIKWSDLRNQITKKSLHPKADKILDLLSIMEKNHHQNRQIDYYTKQVPISRNYITELCRHELNMGFKSLSDLLLIIHILDLFYLKRMTMGEVSQELHFTSQAHFSSFFKSKMKITPREFRDKILI